MMNILNYAGYFSLLLIFLQIVNQVIILCTPIKAGTFTKYFTWREVNKFVDILSKKIKEDNIEYGMICGTGRGGGILAALLSYKMNLVPVLVLDRKYAIDETNDERTSICIEQEVVLNEQFKELLDKPVLLITPQSDPGVTLKKYKKILQDSGFTGNIDKCAIIASERTMDVDLKYTLHRYKPDTKCRKFPWERKSPDLMENPIHIRDKREKVS